MEQMEQKAQSPRILTQFKRCADDGWLEDETKIKFVGEHQGWHIYRVASMSGGQPHVVRYAPFSGECVCSCLGYEHNERCTHALLVAAVANKTILALVRQAVSA
jgi:hypothetical protein